MSKPPNFIAHVRGNETQSLEAHLRGVARLSKTFAGKLGLSSQGELIGLLHDLGKYSDAFQAYIKSATGLLNQDEDEEFVDAAGLRGKIDHSTSGAQLVWQVLSKQGQLGQIVGQTLGLCIASHHSGLIDCLTSSPNRPVEDTFTKRMNKVSHRTHLDEALEKADKAILASAQELLAQPEMIESIQAWIRKILGKVPSKNPDSPVYQQQLGLLVRTLFSCLIDADRIDTADFEHPGRAKQRLRGSYESWEILIKRLEAHLNSFAPCHPIDNLRQDISRHCLDG
ncbi:MAG: CRISPR-associated endonuclease Cas3'', partial [Thiobacillus sp.]|nr:CRISPR-associated endonuclease Cas3'' [Thiobacillus sp.]